MSTVAVRKAVDDGTVVGAESRRSSLDSAEVRHRSIIHAWAIHHNAV